MDDEDEIVEVDLHHDEWNLLRQGVLQLGGPTALDDTVSRAIGYDSAAALRGHWSILLAAIKARQPLSRRDWRRAQIATEITFASNYYGAAGDWEICTMLDDATTIQLLRRVQGKLIKVVGRARRAPR